MRQSRRQRKCKFLDDFIGHRGDSLQLFLLLKMFNFLLYDTDGVFLFYV